VSKISKFFKIINLARNLGIEETLSRIESRDSLTGLYDRRAMKGRRDVDVSIIFMDIDNFKDINDNRGYQEGDRVLKEFGSIIISCSRKDDLFVRWGGDEFVMILPQTKAKEAEVLIERIKSEARERLPLLKFSCGIVENEGEKDISDLVKQASAIMQENKKRNKEVL